MTLKTKPFDASKYIHSIKEAADILNAARETGHKGVIAAARRVFHRAVMRKARGEDDQ